MRQRDRQTDARVCVRTHVMHTIVFSHSGKGGIWRAEGGGEEEKECTTGCKSRRLMEVEAVCELGARCVLALKGQSSESLHPFSLERGIKSIHEYWTAFVFLVNCKRELKG